MEASLVRAKMSNVENSSSVNVNATDHPSKESEKTLAWTAQEKKFGIPREAR